MKKYYVILSLLAMLLGSAVTNAAVTPKTEHRAMWVSAYVSDWPGARMNDGNVESVKKSGQKMLDSLAVNNFTTVYFHVRAMSDAMYKSSYEPWSSTLTGTRGVEPPFDPLQFMIDECHARGLEIYAWINPFRYANGTTNMWGESELDYIHTHPEWLLTNSEQTILNPGIPEVQQQVLDICKEIVTNYDVDGMIMDDYFYNQGGVTSTLDADLYNAYVEAGGSLSQGDWRRDNINQFVKKLNALLISVKPWLRFGISPAGAAGKNAAQYGMPTSPGSDWQYDTIHSDPLTWMFNQDLDFISPQIYWPIGSTVNEFKAMSEWWQLAADRTNRHFYPSQHFATSPDYGGSYEFKDRNEYQEEMDWLREKDGDDNTGIVFFRYGSFYGSGTSAYVKNDEGKSVLVKLMNQIKADAFTYKSYTPPMSWRSNGVPDVPTDVTLTDGVISWNGADNSRFNIYVIPESVAEADFTQQAEYFYAISYEKSYTLPTEVQTGYKYAVSTLDRWSQESSAVFVGQTVTAAPAVELKTPVNDSKMYSFSDFSWTGDCSSYILEIATDADMKNIVFNKETVSQVISALDVVDLKADQTYYCRVTGKKNGCRNSVSAISKFEMVPFCMIYPTDAQTNVPLTPEILWPELPGAKYKITISTTKSMDKVVFEQETSAPKCPIPANTLFGGTTYYVQLQATSGDLTASSVVESFVTEVYAPAVAVLVRPDTEGATVYSNQGIQVAPQPGMHRTRIEIAKTNTFPARSRYQNTLDNYLLVDDATGNLKVSGAALVDGTTYYVRARHEAYDGNGSLVTGEWTTSSFVYSSESGVESATIDNAPYIANSVLVIPQQSASVAIFNAAGVMVDAAEEISGEMPLTTLEQGIYLISINQNGKHTVLKYVK